MLATRSVTLSRLRKRTWKEENKRKLFVLPTVQLTTKRGSFGWEQDENRQTERESLRSRREGERKVQKEIN